MASQCFKCEVVFANNTKEVIACVMCGNFFHPTCTRIGSIVNFNKMGTKKGTWKCDSCMSGASMSGGSSGNVSVVTEEEPKNSEIMESLRQMRAQMSGQMEECFARVQNEIASLKDTIRGLNETVVQLTTENTNLKDKCSALEEQNKDFRGELEDLRGEVRDLQQYSRRDNLEIVGVPCSQGENIYSVMESVAAAIGVDFKKENVSVAHRVTKTGKMAHPNIVAKFTSRTAKMEWWTAAKQSKIKASDLHGSLPGTPVYLNDHLTPYYKSVLGRARRLVREKKLAFAWVNNCRVLVRVTADSRAHRVTSMEELDRLLQDDVTTLDK